MVSNDGVRNLDANPEVFDQFEPWMLVSRKARRPVHRRDNRGGNFGGGANLVKESKKGNRNVTKASSTENAPLIMKDQVSQAVLEALGLLKPNEVGLDQIDEDVEFVEEVPVVNQGSLLN